MKLHVFVILSVALASAAADDGLFGQAMHMVSQCADKDMFVCLKERALKFVDNVNGDYELAEGITLKQTEQTPEEPKNVELPEEGRARESMVDYLLSDKITNFLSSHTLEFKMPKSAVNEMKRSIDEARRRRKKLMLLPLLMLLKLKAGLLIPLAMKAIALIAFKALIVGKIALVITLVMAIRRLMESRQHTQTYEVVAHPHVSHSHISDDHHGHYRSIDTDPQNLAYSAYAP